METHGAPPEIAGPASGRVLPRGPAGLIPRLRVLALETLARMYRSSDGLFAFRLRRTNAGVVREGRSPRYTAIAVIGLAEAEAGTASAVLGGDRLQDVVTRLLKDAPAFTNLGDVALTLWAARVVGLADRGAVWQRLRDLQPADRVHPVVEVAWTLSALCRTPEMRPEFTAAVAQRLKSAVSPVSHLFPHVSGRSSRGLRGHVACFADLIYPIHALAEYFRRSGDPQSLAIATQCARQLCARQGPGGQWWWHYDVRTGEVIERYPVYAVHQDAMAPMALFALHDATSDNYTKAIAAGLTWLAAAPELRGGSLIDEAAGMIWRKVARHEPRCAARYGQAAVSRLHPRLRLPFIDRLFPVGAVDYEDRPYHLGWLLYAWSPTRTMAGAGRL